MQRRYDCPVHGLFYADVDPGAPYEAKCRRDISPSLYCGRYGLAVDATAEERAKYEADQNADGYL